MKYFISYGRGEIVEFKTLKEAKKWQVKNIFSNYCGDDIQVYGEDEINYIATGYKWVKEDDYYQFILINGNGKEIEVDETDGSGWFIERNWE